MSIEAFPEILAAARRGAEWAWVALYRDLSPRVLGYLRARGAPEPEDLASEVFLQVVRDIRRFEGGEPEFRTWLFTIVHHRMLDARRRQARRPGESAPIDVLELHGDVGDAEEEALVGVETARVRRLIGRLPPAQQDVLLLRLFADLTVADVARVVGKRAGAVKALQRRGLATLRREISREAVPL